MLSAGAWAAVGSLAEARKRTIERCEIDFICLDPVVKTPGDRRIAG